MVTEKLDILSPEFHENPYEAYRRAREQGSVHLGMPVEEARGSRAWYVLGYAEILSILKDNRYTRLAPGAGGDADLTLADPVALFAQLTSQSVLFNDPPNHTRLRGMVGGVFTPKMIARLGQRVETVTTELLDAAEHRGTLDVVHEFALPLTLTIIAEMLGVPQSDKSLLDKWAQVLVRAVDSKKASGIYEQAIATSLEIFAYFHGLIEEKRVHPTDDLLSQLVHAHDDGGQLTEQELAITATTLLMAGHDTTVNLIGNGTLLLLQNPDQMRLLRERPDLISSAIEEMLRYQPPAQFSGRYAFEDTSFGGATIPKGEIISLALGSGNHDPAAFTDPERFDITRPGPRHLAFGMGMHYCLGAPLSRLEGTTAIPALINRFPTMQMTHPTPIWRDTIGFRGLERLDVVWS